MIIFLAVALVFSLIINLLILIKVRSISPAKISDRVAQEFAANFDKLQEKNDKNFDKNRQDFISISSSSRQELNNAILQNFTNFSKMQNQSLEQFSQQIEKFEVKFNSTSNENRQEAQLKLDQIRKTMEEKIQLLQNENSAKLEQMRQTVDEKLHQTVEKRFNESFTMIAQRLDQVHKGLGEMQNLASGVGDLKKVLSNVKTRGNIGEIQLGSILEQFFSPAQFEKNVATKKSSAQRVEFAIKIPDKVNEDQDLLLPIDSKFPIEDYQRLMDAYELIDSTNQKNSKASLEQAQKSFEVSVKRAAKEIFDKYLNPPTTTDFGIMFVPTEGLYAEILRSHSLFEEIQRKYKVIILGPTTIVAFLSSLQMGFRTLTVEKRSSEVWNILATVKSEFGKFGDLLEKTRKKIQETGNVLDAAASKSRNIEKKLKNIQQLPANDSNGSDDTSVEIFDDLLKIED